MQFRAFNKLFSGSLFETLTLKIATQNNLHLIRQIKQSEDNIQADLSVRSRAFDSNSNRSKEDNISRKESHFQQASV